MALNNVFRGQLAIKSSEYGHTLYEPCLRRPNRKLTAVQRRKKEV